MHLPRSPLAASLVQQYLVCRCTAPVGIKTVPNGLFDGWITLTGGFDVYRPSAQSFVAAPEAGFFPPSASSYLLQLRPELLCISIKLRPHSLQLPSFSGMHLPGEPVAFERVFPGFTLSPARERIRNTIGDPVTGLDAFIEACFFADKTGDPLLMQALQFLEDSLTETRPLSAFAAACGCSARTLERRFRAAMGVSMKEYQKGLRLHRSVEAIRSRSAAGPVHGHLTQALGEGYYDQSHFIRECRAITGLSPRQLFPRLLEGSSDLLLLEDDGRPLIPEKKKPA